MSDNILQPDPEAWRQLHEKIRHIGLKGTIDRIYIVINKIDERKSIENLNPQQVLDLVRNQYQIIDLKFHNIVPICNP